VVIEFDGWSVTYGFGELRDPRQTPGGDRRPEEGAREFPQAMRGIPAMGGGSTGEAADSTLRRAITASQRLRAAPELAAAGSRSVCSAAAAPSY
jgi:hypothetical protein